MLQSVDCSKAALGLHSTCQDFAHCASYSLRCAESARRKLWMPNCRQTFRSASFALPTVWHASNAHWVAGNHLLPCSLDFGREGQFAGPRFPAESLPTYPGSKEYGEQKRLSKEREWARKQDGISINMAEFTLYQGMQMCLTRHCKQNFCVCVCVVCECVWRCLLIFHGGICCISLSRDR